MKIYIITNQVTGKKYIGQTIQENAKMRWYAHLYSAKKGKQHPLYNSMRKHGISNFLWEIVDSANTLDELNTLENIWEKKLTAEGHELYNIRNTGNNKTHSPESIEKMRQAQIKAHAKRRAEGREGGWKRRDGGCMKGKRNPNKGKTGIWKWDAESKKNLSDITKGRHKGRTWKIVDGKRVWMDKK